MSSDITRDADLIVECILTEMGRGGHRWTFLEAGWQAILQVRNMSTSLAADGNYFQVPNTEVFSPEVQEAMMREKKKLEDELMRGGSDASWRAPHPLGRIVNDEYIARMRGERHE